MRWILLLCGVFILTQSGYCQGYIHLKRDKIKSSFQKYCEKDSINCNIADSNASLLLSIRDSSVLPVDFICYFNKNGKCVEEITKLRCDSCSQKFVKSWLETKKINWHSIDSSHYLSGMGKNLLFTIIDATSFSVKYLRPKEYLAQREKYKEAKLKKRE